MFVEKKALLNTIKRRFERKTRPSSWEIGIHLYALDLIETADVEEFPSNRDELETVLLQGATSWDVYSWSGKSLILNSDIAARLCTLAELKKCRYGERRPNGREEWFDLQARALSQAFDEIYRAIKTA